MFSQLQNSFPLFLKEARFTLSALIFLIFCSPGTITMIIITGEVRGEMVVGGATKLERPAKNYEYRGRSLASVLSSTRRGTQHLHQQHS